MDLYGQRNRTVIIWLDTTGANRIPPWGDERWTVGRKRAEGTLAALCPDYVLEWPDVAAFKPVIDGWMAAIKNPFDPRSVARTIRDDNAIVLADGTPAPAWVVEDVKKREWLIPVVKRDGRICLPRTWGAGGVRIGTPLQNRLIEICDLFTGSDDEAPEDIVAGWVGELLAAANHIPKEAPLALGLIDDALVMNAMAAVIGHTELVQSAAG